MDNLEKMFEKFKIKINQKILNMATTGTLILLLVVENTNNEIRYYIAMHIELKNWISIA